MGVTNLKAKYLIGLVFPIICCLFAIYSFYVGMPFYNYASELESKAFASNCLAENTPYWEPAQDNFNTANGYFMVGMGFIFLMFMSIIIWFIATSTQQESRREGS